MTFKPIRLFGDTTTSTVVFCRFPSAGRESFRLYTSKERRIRPPSFRREIVEEWAPLFILCYRHQRLVIITLYIIWADSRRARVPEKKN